VDLEIHLPGGNADKKCDNSMNECFSERVIPQTKTSVELKLSLYWSIHTFGTALLADVFLLIV